MPQWIIGEAADRSGWWLTHLGECPFVCRIIEPTETMDGYALVDFQFFGPPPGELRRYAAQGQHDSWSTQILKLVYCRASH